LCDTRQRALCRVPEIKHSAKNMALGKEPNSGSEHSTCAGATDDAAKCCII
jgi:hypothetical protein